jgi:cytochrome P450 family 110
MSPSSGHSTTRQGEERAPALPPGPTIAPLLQALQLAIRPTRFFETCYRRFGDCFTIRVPGFPPQVIFCDPEAVKEIFTGDGNQLCAGRANLILKPLLGEHSLLVLDGPQHLRERRMMQPPFHGERMKAYFDTIRSLTDRAIDRWPVGRPFPIHPETQGITLDVIIHTVFGLEEGADFDRLRSLLIQSTSAASPLTLLPALQVDLGPLSPWGRFVRWRERTNDFLCAEIARRKVTDLQTRTDVLSMLIQARDEKGQPMSDQEIAEEMGTLLAAGHETTATALAWAFCHILEHPHVLETLKEELSRVVGDGPLRSQHIQELKYLDATVKETLRLTPIIADIGRRLERSMSIGGHHLPAGVNASPCIYLAHRRPSCWPEPEKFDPQRFLTGQPTLYEFFPFGGGIRRCLGMAFALYEMKVVLAEVLTRASLRKTPGYKPRPVRRNITLAPSKGMPLVLERLVDDVGPKPTG